VNLSLLSQCDRVLSGCGRPVAPKGMGWVDLPYGLQYQKFLPGQTISPGSSPVTTEEKVVSTEAPFLCKSIQTFVQPETNGAVYWRLRFPNGRFLQSQTCAITPSANFGSYRLYLDKPVECEPGSKFYVTVDGLTQNAANATGVSVLLEGCLRYPLKGNPCGAVQCLPDEVIKQARYTLDPNQNILAPEWRLGNQCYPETPAGYKDSFFEYCTNVNSLVAVPWTGEIVANVNFPLDSVSDFVGRSMSVNVLSTTGSAAGLIAIRMRTSTGYELTDGFTLAAPISNVMFPELPLPALGGLYIDFMVVDGSGTSNSTMNVQFVLSGVKRRRVS